MRHPRFQFHLLFTIVYATFPPPFRRLGGGESPRVAAAQGGSATLTETVPAGPRDGAGESHRFSQSSTSHIEGHFDLESQAMDADDVQGGQGQVRAPQQDGAALRMEYHDEADEDADQAPQQVGDPELQDHTLLAIDGAGRLLEPVGLLQQRCDLDLLSVLGGPAPSMASRV